MGSQAQPSVPDGRIDEVNEPVAIDIRQPCVRGQRRRQEGAQTTVQFIQPHCAADRIAARGIAQQRIERRARYRRGRPGSRRSEEHTSELQSLMRISYAVFCLKKKKNNTRLTIYTRQL